MNPNCGGGNPVYACLLIHIPIWFHHARNDSVVSVKDTVKIVDALKKEFNKKKNSMINGNTMDVDNWVRCTIYEDEDLPASMSDYDTHDECWRKVYTSNIFWEWFFAV